MVELNIKNLSKSFGEKKIFENISFQVQSDEKVGFIGRNGTGKSTIFKIIEGSETQDSGHVFINSSIGYLSQIPDYPNKTVMDVIYLAFKDVSEISIRLRELEHQMGFSNQNMDILMKKYGNLMEEFERKDGYNIQTKIDKVISGLNIDSNLLEHEFDSLSGGEKTKIMLAKLLLEEPKILLLDEPTNHLDLGALEWLETFLKNFKGTVLIVSHDRYFLDKVVNKVIELTPDGVEEYNGNYSYYVIEKERRYLSNLKSYLTQQQQIDRMQEQVDRFLSSNSEGLHRKAHEIERRIERIEKLDKPIFQRKSMAMSLEMQHRSGNRVVEFDSLSYGFDNFLFEGINGEIFYKDSIGIIGKNGCGKSTLIKLLLGQLLPIDGIIKTGSNLSIGYLDQNMNFSDENSTVLDYYIKANDVSIQQARNVLAKMLFTGNDVFKKIKNLSGGERSRLKLATIMCQKPNFLVLDEPTNHLDLNSREVLENQLIDFAGTILFVSHDRYFLNKLATKIWLINNQTLLQIDGNYDDYVEYKSKLKLKSYKK